MLIEASNLVNDEAAAGYLVFPAEHQRQPQDAAQLPAEWLQPSLGHFVLLDRGPVGSKTLSDLPGSVWIEGRPVTASPRKSFHLGAQWLRV